MITSSLSSHAGFTLIELLIALTISLLLGLLSFQSFSYLETTRQQTELRRLYQLSQLARSTAVNEQKVITLCGAGKDLVCTKDWQGTSILVFHDQNKNRQLDSNEQLLKKIATGNALIHWRGSNRRFMRYHPEGYLMDWGRFTYCPRDKKTKPRQLVFNRRGRGYFTEASQGYLQEKKLC